MYSGDISLVFRYMLLMPKHPKLASGVDMKLFTRILVVSNPDVSVLFFLSYYNLFPPAGGYHSTWFIFLWAYICHKYFICDCFLFRD